MIEDLMAGLEGTAGTPQRPFHVSQNNWNEQTNKLEDRIRDSCAFEGKWQSYVKDHRLYIPQALQQHFVTGGVITVSTDNHLWLFGTIHWTRLNRLMSRDVGLSPVNTNRARHVYASMHRFSALNEDGSVPIPDELLRYANISNEVAIIGLIYMAEIHDKASYMAIKQAEDANMHDARNIK